jgi:hypothetical protein
MLKIDDLTIYVPKLMTYSTIAFVIIINSLILVSTKNYFSYFDEFKNIKPSEILAPTTVKKEDARKVFESLESMTKFNSTVQSSMPPKKSYSDVFDIRYSSQELKKFVEINTNTK